MRFTMGYLFSLPASISTFNSLYEILGLEGRRRVRTIRLSILFMRFGFYIVCLNCGFRELALSILFMRFLCLFVLGVFSPYSFNSLYEIPRKSALDNRGNLQYLKLSILFMRFTLEPDTVHRERIPYFQFSL